MEAVLPPKLVEVVRVDDVTAQKVGAAKVDISHVGTQERRFLVVVERAKTRSSHIRLNEVRAADEGSFEVGASEFGAGEVASGEFRAAETRAFTFARAKVRVPRFDFNEASGLKASPEEVRGLELRAAEAGFSCVTRLETRVREVCARKLGAAKIRLMQNSASKIRAHQLGAFEVGATQIGTREVEGA